MIEAAPAAIQIADRFHLACNGSAVLARVLARHPAALRKATELGGARLDTVTGASPPPPVRDTDIAGEPTDPRRAYRRARYEEVVTLHRAGWAITAIAARRGLCRPTARTYVQADAFPGVAPRRTTLRAGSAHAAYLRKRWGEGCRDAKVLYKELRAGGFDGSVRMVQRAVATWREDPGCRGRRAPMARPGEQVASPQPRPLSPRQATWLLLRDIPDLTGEERVLRARLLAGAPAVRLALTVVDAFRRMVRARDQEALDPWLEAAAASPVPTIRTFAASIRRDYAAVAAALEYPWSSGQVEG